MFQTTSLKMAVRNLMKSDRLAEPSFSYTHIHMHTHAPLAPAPQEKTPDKATTFFLNSHLHLLHSGRLGIYPWEITCTALRTKNLLLRNSQTKENTFISQAIFNLIPGSSQHFKILFLGEYLHGLNSSLLG